ncbi:MAG TPA: hypothetical protein VFU49_09175 [Ktedonobacteraceae bacterium]|nr:hypothetical protein [Ktedonobacteraceae bacterium]
MSKDRLERKTYRKSPGRQYGHEFEPLRSRSGPGQNGRTGNLSSHNHWSDHEETASQFTQRPDPRRTRQLLRQSILLSKRPAQEEEHLEAETDDGYDRPIAPYMENSRRNSSGNIARPSSRRELLEEHEEQDEWADFEAIDPDLGYEDPLDVDMGYIEDAPMPVPPRSKTLINAPDRRPVRGTPSGKIRPQQFEDDYDDYEDEDEPSRPRKKGSKISRRGLLMGMGAAAVVGTGVAAYELVPKIPQALGDAGTNIEHQLQDAFNQGADSVRKEFITALDNLEGFSLDGAITAARLTRVAYDVFVSPIVKFGATLTGDFLNSMLSALKTARGWLAGAYQDNATLIAIQKVLETWVSQISLMPKQLDAITQTDLDGAQAYLRALQRKIDAEKAKLNGTQTTTPTASPTAKPKQ